MKAAFVKAAGEFDVKGVTAHAERKPAPLIRRPGGGSRNAGEGHAYPHLQSHSPPHVEKRKMVMILALYSLWTVLL